MSAPASPYPAPDSAQSAGKSVTGLDGVTAPKIVVAGAGPAAQSLVRQLGRQRFAGSITVLSNLDDAPAGLMDLAVLPRVSVRLGQPASFIDPANRCVTTADGLEFSYDQLVIATGSAPVHTPVEGSGRCLSYSTIDDADRIGEAVKEATRVLGRRPLGILVGTGAAAGQAEAVLRARGVRPIRTTLRPASVVPAIAGSALSAAGIIFEDGSTMNGDFVVLAEDRVSRSGLAASAGLSTARDGGIVVNRDFRTSVPGIWAIGDAASLDGVRLGLLVAAAPAAQVCAAHLLHAAGAESAPSAA